MAVGEDCVDQARQFSHLAEPLETAIETQEVIAEPADESDQGLRDRTCMTSSRSDFARPERNFAYGAAIERQGVATAAP